MSSESDDLDWTRQRTQALRRDNKECQDCGADVGFRSRRGVKEAQVHHLTPRSEQGTHELDNLITLCRECHEDRHASIPKEERKQRESTRRRRALLTDRERELLASDDEDEREYRYQAASRIRNKIEEELTDDIGILEKHHPELLEELREVVCDGD